MVKINPKYPPKKSLKHFLKDRSHSLFAPDFEKLGYISIQLNSVEWTTVHEWCRENFGEENYTWTGSTFWFDRKDYAEEFAFRWG
jgi:hypothetical protein